MTTDLETYISILMHLRSEFLRQNQDIVGLMSGSAKIEPLTEIELYNTLAGDEWDAYNKNRCSADIIGNYKSIYTSHWDKYSVFSHEYRLQRNEIVDKHFWNYAEQTPFWNITPSPNAPRGKTVTNMLRESLIKEFPMRWQNPKSKQKINMGAEDTPFWETSLLFPRIDDSSDVLWLDYDNYKREIMGGYGNSKHKFYTGYAFPCWGGGVSAQYEVLPPTSLDDAEMIIKSFCSVLKVVYPYHILLWEMLFKEGNW
jgi:hypothetical protein